MTCDPIDETENDETYAAADSLFNVEVERVLGERGLLEVADRLRATLFSSDPL